MNSDSRWQIHKGQPRRVVHNYVMTHYISSFIIVNHLSKIILYILKVMGHSIFLKSCSLCVCFMAFITLLAIILFVLLALCLPTPLPITTEATEEKRLYCVIILSTGLSALKRHSKYICYVIEKINTIHRLYLKGSLLESYRERTPAFPLEMVVPSAHS